MTDTPTARFAAMLTLEEGELGMLPEHRQRRRLAAATRLLRIHVRTRARELGMLADDWQESTAEAGDPEDGAMAVRVSARFTPATPSPDELERFQERINEAIANQAAAEGFAHRFLAGAPTSAEAFEEWLAPRRAAVDSAIERLSPAMEELGRLIEHLAFPPQYITIDEEHHLTAEQLAELGPGRMWITSTADEREPHRHALDLLEELGAVMAGMTARNPVRDSTLADVYAHHLDAIRRAVLHHHDLDDPAGADDRARARRLDSTVQA